MVKINSKWIIYVFITLCLLFCQKPIQSKEIIDVITEPIGVETFVNVGKDFSMTFESKFLFSNPFNHSVKIDVDIQRKYMFMNNSEIYRSDSPEWAVLEDGLYYNYKGELPPYDHLIIKFRRFVDKRDNNPSDGIYDLAVNVYLPENSSLDYNKIQISVPLKKNFEILKEPVNWSSSPDVNRESNDYLILIWEGNLQNVIEIEYTYVFNFWEFLPIYTFIIGFFTPIVLGKTWKYFKRIFHKREYLKSSRKRSNK